MYLHSRGLPPKRILGARGRRCGLIVKSFFKIGSKQSRQGFAPFRLMPNNGDFNPIETVWAQLRKDFAKRKFEDFKHDTNIIAQHFKQRLAQILHSYDLESSGEEHSYLGKQVQGIPARLSKCRKNKYGPCGKQAPCSGKFSHTPFQ